MGYHGGTGTGDNFGMSKLSMREATLLLAIVSSHVSYVLFVLIGGAGTEDLPESGLREGQSSGRKARQVSSSCFELFSFLLWPLLCSSLCCFFMFLDFFVVLFPVS